MRKPSRRSLFPFFSLAALCIGMLGISFVLAQGHTRAASPQKAAPLACGIWSVVKSPNVGSSSNQLSSVAAVSASNIWAVGNYHNTSIAADQTLIEHWNGTSWGVVKSPNVGSSSNQLSSIAAVSASNIWAVGAYHNTSIAADQTLIEHWNGTSWSVVKSPNVGSGGNVLNGVARVPGSGNVWAVGGYPNSSGFERTLIEFYC